MRLTVAVVGAEATGKSVLAAALAARLGLPLLESPRADVLRESGYHTLFEWAAAGHHWAELVRTQARREAVHGSAVIDSGLLDQYALFLRWGVGASAPDVAEALHDQVLTAAHGYDRIIITPPRLVAGHAPERFRNAAHNRQLQRILDGLFYDGALEPRVLRLADGSADERLAQALAALR